MIKKMRPFSLSSTKPLVAALAFALLATAPARAAFDPEYRAYARVLKQSMKDERVNYAALKADPKLLDQAIGEMAEVGEKEFETWTAAGQIAFLTNLYNACTLKLIADHYPVGSIKDLGSILRSAWDRDVVPLFGGTVTLNHIEHEILRKKYEEPRVHFALVCAAKGCPPLREEPYLEKRLDEQLNDQGRKFLSSPSKNRVDTSKRVLYLSPIFHWFRGDFERKAGSVLAFVQPFLPQDQAREVLKGGYGVKLTTYDWSLNDAPAKASGEPQKAVQ